MRILINREKVETFDTLRRNNMKILDTDPELYFDFSRREDRRLGWEQRKRFLRDVEREVDARAE